MTEKQLVNEEIMPSFLNAGAMLEIAHGEERAHLPEFGSLPEAGEYKAILQAAFSL